jgi:hypothetical protein
VGRFEESAAGEPTELRYPCGVLVYDPNQDRLRCHLCGRRERTLAPGLAQAGIEVHRDNRGAAERR